MQQVDLTHFRLTDNNITTNLTHDKIFVLFHDDRQESLDLIHVLYQVVTSCVGCPIMICNVGSSGSRYFSARGPFPLLMSFINGVSVSTYQDSTSYSDMMLWYLTG